MYNIPFRGDPLNLAVIEKPGEGAVPSYELRYFGFDFTDKHSPIRSFPTGKKNSEPDYKLYYDLNTIVQTVLKAEFGDRYYEEDCQRILALECLLIQRHEGWSAPLERARTIP